MQLSFEFSTARFVYNKSKSTEAGDPLLQLQVVSNDGAKERTGDVTVHSCASTQKTAHRMQCDRLHTIRTRQNGLNGRVFVSWSFVYTSYSPGSPTGKVYCGFEVEKKVKK